MPALKRKECGGDEGVMGWELANRDPFVQNLFVLCHGEQVKSEGSQKGVVRPWDPPLTEKGKLQAWRVGRAIRLEDWNVTRVVMSPMLRCVQTAVEVIAGLCMLPSSVHDDEEEGLTTCEGEEERGSFHIKECDQYKENFQNVSINRSMALCEKASIDYGLAEMVRKRGVVPYPSQAADSLQPWTLDLSELYSMLPTAIQDPSFQPTRLKLPSSRESEADVQYRYTSTLKKIANRYPYENILCITHGEGVVQSVSMMWPRAEVYGVTHCAYTHAQRPNFERDDGSCIINGDWELLTESGSDSGVFFSPSNL